MPEFGKKIVHDAAVSTVQRALVMLGQEVVPAEPTDDQLMGVLRKGLDVMLDEVLKEAEKARPGAKEQVRDAALILALQTWDMLRSERCRESTLAVLRIVAAYFAAL